MRLLSVLGASQALTDHLCRHPEQWRELADPFLGSTRPAAYAMRDVLLRAVGADPTERQPDRDRRECRRRGRAPGGVPTAAHPARGARPRPPRRRGRRFGGALRPGGGHPRGGAGDRAGGGARCRVGAPRGDRPRQVRRPRAELRLRRRRPLRLRAGGGCRRGGGGAGRDPARLGADADLLGPHRRGHDLAGRRQPAPGGQGGPVGPDAREPSGLLRAVGQDVGVPGVAEGTPGRGRPRPGATGSSTWSSRWCGRWPTATGSWATCRRCDGACSTPSPPATPSASSSSGPAGSATWSSPSSCCSWCTAAPTTGSATPGRSRRSTRSPRAGTSGGRTARRCTRRTRSCARSSTASSSSTCAAPTSYRPTTRRCAGSAAGWASPRSRPRRWTRPGRIIAARYADSTRSSSTVPCSRPWPGCRPPARGSRRRPPASASPPSGTPIPRAPCAISRR